MCLLSFAAARSSCVHINQLSGGASWIVTRVVVVVVVVKKHERNARARGSGTHTKKRDKRSADTHTQHTYSRKQKRKEKKSIFGTRETMGTAAFRTKNERGNALAPGERERERERKLQNKKRSNAHLTYLLVRMCIYKK